ncbi:MAG: hypothetical protein ACOX54_10360 [Christensenellales bacterium]|jgi:hypothetical protein|nr:hypothetical protein [Christensenellaceae bacterium]
MLSNWRRRFVSILLVSLLLASGALAQVAGYNDNFGYNYLYFGSYPQGANGEVAPIIWRVLGVEDNVAYLMSEYLLFAARIHGDQRNYPGFEKSELNGRLNSEFFDAAFTDEDKGAMVSNEELGYVSLPSVDDLRNKAFGFKKKSDYFFVGTPYALNNGLFRYSSKKYSPLWTRTRSSKSHANRSTKVDGAIGFIGVESDDLGITPVIWLDLSKVEVVSGAGTLDAPFTLNIIKNE